MRSLGRFAFRLYSHVVRRADIVGFQASDAGNENRLGVAEGFCVAGPFAEAGRHHVGDDAADVTLLRRVVVGAGVIARHGHRPGVVATVQPGQEACRIVDVLARIEHLLDAAKLACMIVMIDLHAAEVDQLRAALTRRLKGGEGFRPTFRKYSFSFYIQGIGLKAALLACLGEPDRVEDPDGYSIAISGAQDLRLAGISGGVGGRGDAI